ncbi:hypothetical protein SAMN02745857_00926 [Andreprevotia lacus DSM 23236]|jgi:hypothetical protein|uniref:Uncharacterized protein n=1 Tax=Andreprevotia lacus DSM 23236 TaxID=1121001 RepID=A0A1W1X956_9NEIS|nr:hypothetical protein [Andreprevotia lacus]SMC20373.1 hypothetical protein SAMN02745857_00926 [Andreprevotia lacus DSM 23236]
MRSGWNPGRRNRHCGTKAHGHGQDNRMVVPMSWHRDSLYIEQLGPHVSLERDIGTHRMRFLVQPSNRGYFYPCSIDDIVQVLRHCKPEHLQYVDAVVLRQPTRKQSVLVPVWGRAQWLYETTTFSGSAIVLEAQSLAPYPWPANQGPEGQRELQRLRRDGHPVERTRRNIILHPTVASLRNTQLYRTLLHELGHHVDYQRSSSEEWAGKTRSTKEDFAHRYADEAQAAIRALGHIPFAPLQDREAMLTQGLDPAWFSPPDASTDPEHMPSLAG